MGRAISRSVSFTLRLAEVICGTVVLGILAYFILEINEQNKRTNTYAEVNAREIYGIIIAAASCLLSLLFMPPLSRTLMYWPLDFLMAVAWFVAFAVLYVMYKEDNRMQCDQNMADLQTLTIGGVCNQRKTIDAFSFFNGCLWLASSMVGAWVVWRERRLKKAKGGRSPAA